MWVINNVDVEYIINDVFFTIERNVEFGEKSHKPEYDIVLEKLIYLNFLKI